MACILSHIIPTWMKTYGITIEEFREIADTLVEKLHIGSCDPNMKFTVGYKRYGRSITR